jgi:hypothetical protein
MSPPVADAPPPPARPALRDVLQLRARWLDAVQWTTPCVHLYRAFAAARDALAPTERTVLDRVIASERGRATP